MYANALCAWRLFFGLVRKNEFALCSTQRVREILLTFPGLFCRPLLTIPTLIVSNVWENYILCAWVAKPRLRVKFSRFKKSVSNKRGYKSRRIIRRVFGKRLLSCRKDVPCLDIDPSAIFGLCNKLADNSARMLRSRQTVSSKLRIGENTLIFILYLTTFWILILKLDCFKIANWYRATSNINRTFFIFIIFMLANSYRFYFINFMKKITCVTQS